MAPLAGIDSDRVVGIRSVTDRAGRLTYTFEGCGPVSDGNQSMIAYIEGKRCWVNKVVFGDTSAAAIDRRHDPRQVLGAGDSVSLQDGRVRALQNGWLGTVADS